MDDIQTERFRDVLTWGVLNVTHPQILRIQQTSSSLGRKYPDILHGSLQNFCVKVW